MANKPDFYSPLTEEERKAIEEMDLDSLLEGLKDTLDEVEPTPVKKVTPAVPKAPTVPTVPTVPAAHRAKTAHSHATAVMERPQAKTPPREVPMPESLRAKNRKPEKKHRFGRGLLIYAIVAIVLVAAASGVLWKYLEYYEAARPEPVVEQYLTGVDDAYWQELIKSSAGLFPTTEFESGADIAAQCCDAVKGGEATYRKRTGEYTAEKPVYTIRVGDYDIARLTLRQYAVLGFGFYSWAADTVELAPEFVPSARAVTVSVPDGAKVVLNGVELAAKYITDSVPYTGLGELEKQFTTPLPSTSVYTVAGLYGNIELTVTSSDGKTLKATKADGMEYEYEMTLDTRTVTVVAPENAKVQLCGVDVPDSYITDTKPIELLSRVSDYITDSSAANLCTYTIPGIYTEEITVTAADASGNALAGLQSEDGTWSFGIGSGTIPADRKALVEDFMEAYLYFTSDVNDATDSNWYSLQQHILYDGDLYQRMEMALDGLEWIRSYDAVMHSCDILSYAEFGEKCFVVRVTMDYSVSRSSGTTEEKTSFDVVFVDDGNGFVAETMEAV